MSKSGSQFSTYSKIFWPVCISAIFVISPAIGSLGSAIILILSIVAWYVWLSKEIKQNISFREKYAIFVVCFYFFSTLLCSSIRAERFTDTYLVWNNLGLILGLSLLPVFRLRSRQCWIDTIVVSVAISGLLTATATTVLLLNHGYNFELFSGNALILAYLIGTNALFGLVFFLNHKKYTVLSLLGLAASVFALVATGRRGPILALVLAFLPVIVVSFNYKSRKIGVLVLIVVVASLAIYKTNGKSTFEYLRIDEIIQNAQGPIDSVNLDRSIYVRLAMYQDGIEAFKRAPIFGYGRQHAVDAAMEFGKIASSENIEYHYSHLHNAFITEAVSSGLFGIVGLLLMYSLPIVITVGKSPTVARLGISYTVFFVSYGLTNVGFYHDVTVFSFIFILAILNAIGGGHSRLKNFSAN